jgi:hypothetical protein
MRHRIDLLSVPCTSTCSAPVHRVAQQRQQNPDLPRLHGYQTPKANRWTTITNRVMVTDGTWPVNNFSSIFVN